jgi:hypothetical protein
MRLKPVLPREFATNCPIGAKGQHREKSEGNAANFGVVNYVPLWHCQAEQLNREFKMSFKKASVAAALAVSMASTPVLAQTASSAAPLSVAARSGATTSNANDMRGGFIIPLIAVIAIILGILAATQGNNDRPHSP